MPIKRRKFLQSAVLLPGVVWSGPSIFSLKIKSVAGDPFHRVRPGDPLWPSDEKWQQLNKDVNGSLLKLESPFANCGAVSNSQACDEIFKGLKNPYFIGDDPALTQTSGWLNAWRSESSVYAVTAKSTNDVVAAVNFARENHLRLVVKGGGHSYKGTSNAPDSLLIWTRAMNQVIMHDDFVAEGCAGSYQPQPAVTIDAGAMWLHAYDAVITKGGRYVQGGGCLTVGVAGLVQGGGFGSFSKYYGLAAAALLEAEIVTADGSVKKANACTNPDLFWALKGGGGGSFGVVTKLTLRTRELPENFGAVFCTIRAASEKDFIVLIKKFISHYAESLFNPVWGEQVRFRSDNSMSVNMLFHGLSKEQADAAWLPFIQWVKETPGSYTVVSPFTTITIPSRHLWDTAFLKKYASQTIETDDRPNAPESNVYWKTNREEAGQFLYGYHSAWMPESLLAKDNQSKLADALFSASRHWSVTLHFNKGL
ncbi:MAG: FAD-binding oxidoreductase, partial [Bacteroidota bacterium]|nr:FAD-binding oxidoreductase [Bacteroidota bacterium]